MMDRARPRDVVQEGRRTAGDDLADDSAGGPRAREAQRRLAAEKRDEGDERAHEHGRRVRPGSALDAPVEGAEQGEFERCADDDEHHVHAEAALDVAADTQEVIDREQNGGDGREHGVDAHVRDRLRRELPGRAHEGDERRREQVERGPHDRPRGDDEQYGAGEEGDA